MEVFEGEGLVGLPEDGRPHEGRAIAEMIAADIAVGEPSLVQFLGSQKRLSIAQAAEKGREDGHGRRKDEDRRRGKSFSNEMRYVYE